MLLRGNNEKNKTKQNKTKLCNRGGSRGKGARGAHPLPPPPTRGPVAFLITFGGQRNESMHIRRYVFMCKQLLLFKTFKLW